MLKKFVVVVAMVIGSLAFAGVAQADQCWEAWQWNWCMSCEGASDSICGLCEAAGTAYDDCVTTGLSTPGGLEHMLATFGERIKDPRNPPPVCFTHVARDKK